MQYVQREAALGTAALYGNIQVLAKESTDPAAAFGVLGNHVVFEPHCFKYIHTRETRVTGTAGAASRRETSSSAAAS